MQQRRRNVIENDVNLKRRNAVILQQTTTSMKTLTGLNTDERRSAFLVFVIEHQSLKTSINVANVGFNTNLECVRTRR